MAHRKNKAADSILITVAVRINQNAEPATLSLRQAMMLRML